MWIVDRLRHYLRDEGGFLGLGGDKKSTSTTSMSKEDMEYIRGVRESGQDLQNLANQGGPWAQGVNPYTTAGMTQYQDLLGQYGGIASQYGGMAQDAFGGAMQTGLSGIGGYANPYAQLQINAMKPTWDYQRDLASMQGKLGGNAPGVSHSQQARSALLEAELLGGVNRAQSQFEGDVWGQAGAQGLQAMMAERARMAGLGGQMAGLGLSGLGGQMDANRNLMLGGDYLRNVDRELATDEWNRATAGHGALQQSFMGPMSQTTKNVEKGSVLGDLMSIGGMAAGFALGGGGGASAASTILGGLGGGGSSSIANSPIMQPGVNIWNYGGGYGGLGFGGR